MPIVDLSDAGLYVERDVSRCTEALQHRRCLLEFLASNAEEDRPFSSFVEIEHSVYVRRAQTLCLDNVVGGPESSGERSQSLDCAFGRSLSEHAERPDDLAVAHSYETKISRSAPGPAPSQGVLEACWQLLVTVGWKRSRNCGVRKSRRLSAARQRRPYLLRGIG